MCARDRASDSNRLKDTIEDNDLRKRADNVWSAAERLLKNATLPGGSQSGYDHATNVDSNIGRILDETHRLNDFGDHHRFLLTCAAAYHDVAKGIGEESWLSKDHGEASGSHILKNHAQLHLRIGEARCLQRIVSVHNRKGDRLERELANLSEPCTTEEGEKDPRLFATLLKLADLLQAGSRVDMLTTDLGDKETAAEEAEQAALNAPQNQQLRQDADRKRRDSDIAFFRSRVMGWTYLPSTATIVIRYLVEEEVDSVRLKQCANILIEDEFEPLRAHLSDYGFPEALKCEGEGDGAPSAEEREHPFTRNQRAIGNKLAHACSNDVADYFYAGAEIAGYSNPLERNRALVALIIRTIWDEVQQTTPKRTIMLSDEPIIIQLPASEDQADVRAAWEMFETQILRFL